MASLDGLFSVQVFRNTLFPAQQGFGTPIVLGFHNRFTDRLRYYASLKEAEDAGFTLANEPQIHRHVESICAQSPHVNKFAIGRLSAAPAKTLRIFPKSFATGKQYTFVIRDTAETRNVINRTAGGVSIAAECTAIAALIDALPLVVATATATYVEVTPSVATGFVRVDEMPSADDIEVLDVTADPGISADLTAIETADRSGWYALDIVSGSRAEALAVVAWAETRKKLFLFDTIDSDCQLIGSTSDVGSTMKAASRLRTRATYYMRASDPTHSAALMGFKLAVNLDTATTSWEYAGLSGIIFDNLTDGQLTVLASKNLGAYVEAGGVAVELYTKTAVGEFIDTVHGLDWFQSRLQTDLFGAVRGANNSGGKIPYTNKGARTLQGIAEIRVRAGIRTGLIDGDRPWSVTVTPVEEIDPADRSARRYNSVQVRFYLAGAIHTAEVVVNVSI